MRAQMDLHAGHIHTHTTEEEGGLGELRASSRPLAESRASPAITFQQMVAAGGARARR